MNVRRFLKYIVGLLFVIGLIGSLIPFLLSMNPSMKAEAELTRVDLSGIKNGEALIVGLNPIFGNSYNGYGWSYLVYRKHNGQVNVWDIPLRENVVGLPDIYWHRPSFPCYEFGPTIVGGRVDESKPIKCHRSDNAEAYYMDFEWDIDGKAINGHVKDMLSTKGIVVGSEFVFGKSS